VPSLRHYGLELSDEDMDMDEVPTSSKSVLVESTAAAMQSSDNILSREKPSRSSTRTSSRTLFPSEPIENKMPKSERKETDASLKDEFPENGNTSQVDPIDPNYVAEYAYGTTRPHTTKKRWPRLAERRLFQLIKRYKPIGCETQFNRVLIHNGMNKIGEWEDDPTDLNEDIDVYIKEKDLKRYDERLCLPQNLRYLTFEPAYDFRPTLEQIDEKLNSIFNLNKMNKIASTPAPFLNRNDGFEKCFHPKTLKCGTEKEIHSYIYRTLPGDNAFEPDVMAL
jgi:hypothetical protein